MSTIELPPELERELGRFSAFGYGEATALRWLQAPHPQLALSTPLEALANGREDDVLAALRNDYARMYAF